MCGVHYDLLFLQPVHRKMSSCLYVDVCNNMFWNILFISINEDSRASVSKPIASVSGGL